MKTLLVAAFLVALVWCNVEDRLFPRYDSDGDGCMNEMEWERLWYHFDLDDNGNVTKLEFDTTWRREDFNDKDRAPLFFLEMDRVADEVLNSEDFVHTFKLFDENANGCITSSEFRYNWRGLFDN
ncbi:uncharacterized protein LOC143299954 [Babylonia areolata]|uniref:uncharacterized protein LOC143299954 n=1 Tax=Babylonia areolata TaxID=304850 RepID=UPI003FD5C6A9